MYYRNRMNPNTDLNKELRILQVEYWDNPPYLQRKDLVRINELRAALGQPLVDARLQEIVVEEEPETSEASLPQIETTPDPHAMAREIYERYLAKKEMMRPHLEYASQMVRALAGRNQTPVRPLALGGTLGGAVLCDYCEKQIPLESGPYHGKGAGEAWILERRRRGSEPPRDWTSYILGHVTFLQEDNGTFRCYHGYENRGCGGKALKHDAEKRKAFRESGPQAPKGLRKAIHEYLQDEHSMFGMKTERERIYTDILRTLYSYDPGIGVNRPD